MQILLKNVSMQGGLLLLSALFFQGWLSKPAGEALPSITGWLTVSQCVFLAAGLVFDKIQNRLGKYGLFPLVIFFTFAISWWMDQSALKVVAIGLAGLHGFLELLWFLLGRIKRGGGALLLLLLLIPILLGAYALQSPRVLATGDTIEPLHALFTAVSAVTVTGLTVIDVSSTFSSEGQWILLILIQMGGLGAISLFLLFMSFLGDGLGLRQGRAVREAMDGIDPASLKFMVGTIFLTTLVFEICGFLLLTLTRWNETGHWSLSFDDLFHSISAFCNAGFSLQADSLASMDFYSTMILAFLIIIGGLGFPVFKELYRRIQSRSKRIGTHVYLSVGMSSLLWIGGTALLILGGLGYESLFWSITARTAGFSIGPMDALTDFSIFVLIILMIIGASPGSTGGGLKTSTIAILMIALVQQIRGRKQVQLLKRALSNTLVRSAMVLTVVYVSAWILLSGILHLTESEALDSGQLSQQQLLFEATSALGTVGLSLDSTSLISEQGHWFLMAGMILGRIGPLAVIVILASLPHGQSRAERPEAKVMLG